MGVHRYEKLAAMHWRNQVENHDKNYLPTLFLQHIFINLALIMILHWKFHWTIQCSEKICEKYTGVWFYFKNFSGRCMIKNSYTFFFLSIEWRNCTCTFTELASGLIFCLDRKHDFTEICVLA